MEHVKPEKKNIESLKLLRSIFKEKKSKKSFTCSQCGNNQKSNIM